MFWDAPVYILNPSWIIYKGYAVFLKVWIFMYNLHFYDVINTEKTFDAYYFS